MPQLNTSHRDESTDACYNNRASDIIVDQSSQNDLMNITSNFIKTPNQLTEFCKHLKNVEWMALDTEFMRESTYFPIFCLLQIATEERVACIDPIALPSLSPLYEIIMDTSIVKVLHSCRQDIEIIYLQSNKIPNPIFDTQLAAPFLGLAESISYADLINELLGVQLNKDLTRTDWSKRPLSPEQLRYATDDVTYLAQAYKLMLAKLKKLNRLDWLEPKFNEISNPSLYENASELAWKKIGATQYLKDSELSIIQALATWRETTAKLENIPRGWLIKDDYIIALCKKKPRNLAEIKSMHILHERIYHQYGSILCDIIQEAQLHKPEPIEVKMRLNRKTPEQEALFDELQKYVEQKALLNQINPKVLASRKDLNQIVHNNSQLDILQGYRKELIGDELLAIAKERIK